MTLPKGTYRLSSAYYNVGTSGAGNSLLAWLPDNGTATVSNVKNFSVKSWKTDELIFTLTAQTTGKIRIGFAANEGAGSANHAKILVDYVKLLAMRWIRAAWKQPFRRRGQLTATDRVCMPKN